MSSAYNKCLTVSVRLQSCKYIIFVPPSPPPPPPGPAHVHATRVGKDSDNSLICLPELYNNY